ncbi:uncharacterized protein MELLADRAFT_124359 [Melampsora larici-populina 98AG31]|uniref:Secreted protein n=1 Tax=Melampsora larici-populina (strain 98AG31 / pathotype 3-4-7) TaxID=747676 RepID=F4R9F7_MELLP|nr:uncharacterized protein MELLADRAFT_124359 [Melampsora larici-populina 98AG31]EGG11160.1 secreted protein [Melampsora larici-populina 98AG31]
MNAIRLIGVIVLICTSSAIVQAMFIGNRDEFVSCKPVIEDLDTQSFRNRDAPSSFRQHQEGCSGPGDDDDDDSCCGCNIM